MKSKSTTPETLDLLKIEQGSTVALIVGTSPMVFNAVSAKAQRELLLPSGRKNAAARQQNLKHDPIEEYRNSVYATLGVDAPTRLCFPAAAFKRAMANAALDIPGATKAAVGRLSWVVGDKVAIYGVPQLFMAVVRSADIQRTPDIRTRAILPRWACAIRINFVTPQLSELNVAHLLGAAGILCGIGDGRQEKGALNYGQFRIADGLDDPELVAIMEAGGREAQDAALAAPVCYDDQTEQLFGWATGEILRRRSDTATKDIPPGEEDGIDLGAMVAAQGAEKRKPGRPRKTGGNGLLLP